MNKSKMVIESVTIYCPMPAFKREEKVSEKTESCSGSWGTVLLNSSANGLIQSPDVQDPPEINWKCMQKLLRSISKGDCVDKVVLKSRGQEQPRQEEYDRSVFKLGNGPENAKTVRVTKAKKQELS
ncbi:hypothetical protein BTVI_87235 [Pitangus sulphuratus]|nr:hypothetical protein BTVI_87235 [Pitangus sulphuratus]